MRTREMAQPRLETPRCMHARHEEGGETDVVLVAGREAPVPADTLEPLVQPVIDLFIYISQAILCQ